MHCHLLEGTLFVLSLSEALILVKALIHGLIKGHLLDLSSHGIELGKLLDNWLASTLLDFCLALGARHKREGDLHRAPSVLEELLNAACVVQMTTAKLDNFLATELACVTDGAELVFVAGSLSAARLQAGDA